MISKQPSVKLKRAFLLLGQAYELKEKFFDIHEAEKLYRYWLDSGREKWS